MRQTLSLTYFLFLLLVLVVPTKARAEIVTQGDFVIDCEVVGENCQATLLSYSGNASHLVLPATFQCLGRTWDLVRIGDQFAQPFIDNDTLESVVLPEYVAEIAPAAFYNCALLSSVTLNRRTSVIGDYAFARCKSLKEISFPYSLTYIGYAAFSACSLDSVTVPPNVTTMVGHTFDGTPLKVLRMLTHTPPACSFSMDEDVCSACRLIVPLGFSERWLGIDPWQKFASIVEMADPGDINADRSADITDLNILINVILGQDNTDDYEGRDDINQDQVVDIADLNFLINYILGNY